MVATQLTLIELASKITVQNFEDRNAAAQAVVNYADLIICDPERHFASIWGMNVPATPLDLAGGLAGFQAIAAAADIKDLQHGAGGMKIDIKRAEEWRRAFTDRFVSDVEDMIRFVAKPNYATRRKAGKMDFLSVEADQKLLRAGLELPEVLDAQVLLTRTRAATHGAGSSAEPTPVEVDEAWPKVMPFVKAYLKYVEMIATTYAARPNDWVDLHFFAYLQDGRVLVTNEKRWIEVARNAGIGDLVCALNTLR